jgi:hypothetical protein
MDTMVMNAITTIKNNGDCGHINCSDCFINKNFCAEILYNQKPSIKIALLVQYLIAVYGEQETKELLTEELI